jgi:hypothetical protein
MRAVISAKVAPSVNSKLARCQKLDGYRLVERTLNVAWDIKSKKATETGYHRQADTGDCEGVNSVH